MLWGVLPSLRRYYPVQVRGCDLRPFVWATPRRPAGASVAQSGCRVNRPVVAMSATPRYTVATNRISTPLQPSRVGSAMRPRNRIAPVFRSRMANRNGWSARKMGTGGGSLRSLLVHLDKGLSASRMPGGMSSRIFRLVRSSTHWFMVTREASAPWRKSTRFMVPRPCRAIRHEESRLERRAILPRAVRMPNGDRKSVV